MGKKSFMGLVLYMMEQSTSVNAGNAKTSKSVNITLVGECAPSVSGRVDYPGVEYSIRWFLP